MILRGHAGLTARAVPLLHSHPLPGASGQLDIVIDDQAATIRCLVACLREGYIRRDPGEATRIFA